MITYKVTVIPLTQSPAGYFSENAIANFEVSTPDPTTLHSQAECWMKDNNVTIPEQFRITYEPIGETF